MPEAFEYVSHARLMYKDGYRNAYLGGSNHSRGIRRAGETARVLWGKEGPPVASTLDHIVAAVAG